MFILHSLPDVWPATAANAAFRAQFYRRWGKEHAIVRGRARRVVYPPYAQTLSLKAAWHGAETYAVGPRQVRVDDDSWLVLNEGRTYGAEIDGAQPTESFAVFFAPGYAGRVAAEARVPMTRVLDSNAARSAPAQGFAEHLHGHDAFVSPLLRQLIQAVDRGEDDDCWYEERLQLLVEAMLVADGHHVALADRIPAARAGTRAELRRRVGLAADCIASRYAEALTLNDMARAAGLTKFHLVRLFRAVHGMTPMEALRRKRTSVAVRMLRTECDLTEVAVACGFGTRFTLFRQLRSRYGKGGLALRGLPDHRRHGC